MTAFEIGDSIGPHREAITNDQVLHFMGMRPKMVGDGRFTDLAAAKELGLKGLIVPGPLQGAILARVVRNWAPEATMTKLDIVFRRNIMQGQEVVFEGMVVDTDEDECTAEVDLLILDDHHEKLVTGSATLKFPACFHSIAHLFDHRYNLHMRVSVPLDQVLRLITPGPVTLISAFHKDRFTVTPVGWTTPLSLRPPLIGVVLQQSRFVVELIRASGEFGLSIVSKDDAGALFRAGFISGRDQEDKFTATGLKPVSGKKIAAPLVDTALAHIECAVERGTDFHDHTLFSGEVLYAEADEHAFDGTWLGGEKSPLHYLGLNRFSTLTDRFIPR